MPKVSRVVLLAMTLLMGTAPSPGSAERPLVEVLEDDTIGAEIEAQMFDDAKFELAKPHILPQLAPKEIFSEEEWQRLLHAEFLHGLVLYYVVDHPEVRLPPAMAGIGRPLHRLTLQDDLTQWRVSEEQVFRAAMENINNPDRHQTFQQTEPAAGGGKVLYVEATDGVGAARLLSIGLLGYWAEILQDDLVLSIPTKEYLFATGASNGEGIVALKNIAAEQVEALDRPLMKALFLFRVQDGTISAYPEDNSSQRASKRFRFLRTGPIHGGPVSF